MSQNEGISGAIDTYNAPVAPPETSTAPETPSSPAPQSGHGKGRRGRPKKSPGLEVKPPSSERFSVCFEVDQKTYWKRQALSAALLKALEEQYHQPRHWSVQLHYDNLRAWVDVQPELGPLR